MATSTLQAFETTYTRKQVAFSLGSIFLAYLVYSYYVQTPGIAAPRIAADLDGMALYAWGVSIPGLGLAFGTILFGKLSDIYGRRSMLLLALGILVGGAVACALSPTFIFLIIARTALSIGQGAVAPIVFSVVGDIYPPAERGKWIGLLNIPTGVFALTGPPLGGFLVDTLSWRHIFWWGIPLLAITIIATAGMPALIQSVTKKIDFSGIATVAVASTTLILGLSFAGTTYPWGSVEVIGLLAVSALFWILFLKAESKAEEPILDLKVLRNRIFLTASGAGFLSFFAITAMMVYYPLMLQGMQGVSATNSGYIVMPLGLLMSFFGVPVGFLISRTKRYKWMYLVSYALLTATMSGMVFYDSSTPLIWGILAAIIGGIGFGSIPTINTLVIQCAIPKRLLGVAMGALFFSISMGVAIAPAILGSAMNIQYNNTLKATLPAGLDQSSDEATMTSLGNPRVLLSDSAMASLKERLAPIGLLDETVQSIRSSMDAGLKAVFLIGALAMLAALLLILTIPEIPIDRVADE